MSSLPAFRAEALYSKSKIFIAKGLRAKQAGDLAEYQLWASLALELVGKSALAKINPVLVADPTHVESLFAACGRTLSPDVKSISAKTVFDRLAHISKDFDLRVRKFCEQMALRRNADLHSGESPFSGMTAESWEKGYWYAAEVILRVQGESLDSWLGTADAKAPKDALEHGTQAMIWAVKERIERFRDDFLKRNQNPTARKELIDRTHTIAPVFDIKVFDLEADGYEFAKCPACEAHAVIGGVIWDEQVSEDIDPDNPWVEFVNETYLSEEFHCPTCGLHLNGRREIGATDLPEEFYKVEEREREFEPEYGNE